MTNLKKVIYLSLLIAMEVIFTRFLSINTTIVRIGFGFLPIAIAAIMFGPIYGGIMAALSDLIGMMLFPTGGTFFPGFTISAFVTGVVFGLVLYKKKKTVSRIASAVLIDTLIVTLILNTIWLSIITGNGVYILLPTRLLKAAIMIPIEIVLIHQIWLHLASHTERLLAPKTVESRSKSLEI